MSAATIPAEPAARRHRPFGWVQQSLTLAWRNLIRIKENPEVLADVTFQPIIFLLLFVFVFGGAISQGGTWQDYLPFLLPGLLVQTVLFSTPRHRDSAERRLREGRVRPVPQPADRPGGAADRGRAR